VLRRIFGPEREEDGSWRELYNDELHSLYSSPNIVMVIKSRRMRWAVHLARMGRGEVFTGFWLGGDHWEELGVGGRITDVREMGTDGANWVRLVRDRVSCRAFVSTVMNLQVP
jgi:hypothetical protein